MRPSREILLALLRSPFLIEGFLGKDCQSALRRFRGTASSAADLRTPLAACIALAILVRVHNAKLAKFQHTLFLSRSSRRARRPSCRRCGVGGGQEQGASSSDEQSDELSEGADDSNICDDGLGTAVVERVDVRDRVFGEVVVALLVDAAKLVLQVVEATASCRGDSPAAQRILPRRRERRSQAAVSSRSRTELAI